jgi:hypothetical protein
MGRFSSTVVIGTNDGGIFVADFDYDDDSECDGFTMTPRHAGAAELYIFKDKAREWLVKELLSKGVISSGEYDEFLKQRAEEMRVAREKVKLQRETEEYQKYLQLKEKYEKN